MYFRLLAKNRIPKIAILLFFLSFFAFLFSYLLDLIDLWKCFFESTSFDLFDLSDMYSRDECVTVSVLCGEGGDGGRGKTPWRSAGELS